MEERVVLAMQSTGLQEPELSKKMLEIIKIATESAGNQVKTLDLNENQIEKKALSTQETKEKITTVLEERNNLMFMPNQSEPFTSIHHGYFPNGSKQFESQYKNGKKDGFDSVWHENGQKRFEIGYKDGVLDGLSRVWHEDGSLLGEVVHVDGKIVKNTLPADVINENEPRIVKDIKLVVRDDIAHLPDENNPFTGIQVMYFSNGQKRSETSYLNGKKDGEEKIWFENGQKRFVVINNKQGRRNGLFTMWNENSRKSMEGNYINGKQNGVTTFWYDNGQKRAELIYKNDVEIESVIWDEQGIKLGSVDHKTQDNNFNIQEIIQRCRSSMGEYGSAMVKACVDQDIEAEKALRKY
ncbi:MAG: toxin-antitoxin system YwqK family antitoxin [Methylococcaceae bacterium]|nr:toxin-antitoxin system YwqK family antitoxin [Methylococcaceae bacterium]